MNASRCLEPGETIAKQRPQDGQAAISGGATRAMPWPVSTDLGHRVMDSGRAGYVESMTQRERPAPGYLLGADESERTRLLAQAEIHRAETEALFDRIEVPAGGRAIDFGCGPLGALDLLSRRVGPSREVVGLDSAARMIGFAQRSIAERGLGNVQLIHADAAATGLDAESFDLAHARLVLVNLTSPHPVVAEMARVVRPGGWVAVQDVD